MEFEQWFEQYAPTAPEILDECAKAAWDAATKAEREACAHECEAQADESGGQDWYVSGAMDCADAIRKRSNA